MKMIFQIILASVLIPSILTSFGDQCAFFRHNIAPCSPPILPIPYVAYNPEVINVNAIKYPHGTIAMLRCPANHYLEVEGSRWRICKNGTWGGSFGKCKPLGT